MPGGLFPVMLPQHAGVAPMALRVRAGRTDEPVRRFLSGSSPPDALIFNYKIASVCGILIANRKQAAYPDP